MENVLLVVHLIIAVAMILLILIQRNAQDGGGLLGGGGTFGGMFTARGGANMLTRTTAVLAAGFIVTSLVLTVIAGHGVKSTRSLVDEIPPVQGAAPVVIDPNIGMPQITVNPDASRPLDVSKDASQPAPSGLPHDAAPTAVERNPQSNAPAPEAKSAPPQVPMAQ